MAKVPIPTDWDAETFCCKVVEWPQSPQWEAILLGLLTWPLRGRFWDGATGNIRDVQSVGRQIFDLNVIEGCALVGCLDDLALSIANLTAAVFATGTCGGSAGAGITAGTPSDFEDSGSNFPSGYADREEYIDDKCNLAQFIIDRFDTDFDSIKVAGVSGQTSAAVAAILGIAILTPIPLDELLVAVVAGVLGLVAIGILAYTTAVTELQARIAAMDICELRDADDVEEAVANVEAWIDGGTYTQQTLTVLLGKGFVGTDAFNVLFEPKSSAINYDELPVGDCGGCEQECTSTMTSGTGDPEVGGLFTSAFVGPAHEIGLWVSAARDMDITLTGWTPIAHALDSFRFCSERDTSCGDTLAICFDVYSSDTNPFPTQLNGVGRFKILSSSAFTMNITYS